jgi:hypothetical protein
MGKWWDDNFDMVRGPLPIYPAQNMNLEELSSLLRSQRELTREEREKIADILTQLKNV